MFGKDLPCWRLHALCCWIEWGRHSGFCTMCANGQLWYLFARWCCCPRCRTWFVMRWFGFSMHPMAWRLPCLPQPGILFGTCKRQRERRLRFSKLVNHNAYDDAIGREERLSKVFLFNTIPTHYFTGRSSCWPFLPVCRFEISPPFESVLYCFLRPLHSESWLSLIWRQWPEGW